MRLIPVGSADRRHRELIERLMQEDSETLLVDIRLAPSAIAQGWNLTALREVYGKRYRWFGPIFRGRCQDRSRPVDWEKGLLDLQMFLWQGHTVFLMCECIRYRECLRRDIASKLTETWSEFEVMLPEHIMGQQVLLERLREERQVLERELNEPKPLPPRHWSASDYERGFFGEEQK